jgi:hypothetical protein
MIKISSEQLLIQSFDEELNKANEKPKELTELDKISDKIMEAAYILLILDKNGISKELESIAKGLRNEI